MSRQLETKRIRELKLALNNLRQDYFVPENRFAQWLTSVFIIVVVIIIGASTRAAGASLGKPTNKRAHPEDAYYRD